MIQNRLYLLNTNYVVESYPVFQIQPIKNAWICLKCTESFFRAETVACGQTGLNWTDNFGANINLGPLIPG